MTSTRSIELQLAPELAHDNRAIETALRGLLQLGPDESCHYRVVKRSLDARKKIFYRLQVDISTDGPLPDPAVLPQFEQVDDKPVVHIIGAGPAGMFAALRCLERGLKPVIYERGKQVRARRRDLAKLNKEHIVDVDSNYCFGEGGAGTYSDGKLYTRSKKRGNVRSVLATLVAHGADNDIQVDAHPHIGTNKLPQIITEMRETIERCGGEVHFEKRLTDLAVEAGQLTSVTFQDGTEVPVEHLILATGHSARDIFEILVKRDILIEAKSFALGVRVEHPQELIDRVQYQRKERGEFLPPAAYNLVCQIDGRGVYSFCMCPGGIIAPCATAPGEVVTNGWSPSRRNNPYANSGMVVEIKEEDLEPYKAHGPLAGMHFQAGVEQRAWDKAGRTQAAPAQRLLDFTRGKQSSDLPDCSYYPGIVSVELAEVLPARIYRALQEGFKEFGRRMPAYLTNDAVVVATESRSSSPVRIPRDKQSLEHLTVKGLYPCGEGAGYAGGIVSAAIDGQRCVDSIAVKLGVLAVEG